MKPALPHHRGRAPVAVIAAAALATGCDGGQYNTGTMHGTTAAISPATPTVSGQELVRLWKADPLPCDHPIGVSGAVADPYNLLETAMWPNTADVASRLGAVTATGGREFILGRLQMLGVVVLQTQSDIADQVKTGTHGLDAVGGEPAAAAVIRDESMRVIKLRHQNYVAAVDHVIGELEAGAILPSAQLGHKYRLDRVCPDG